MRCKRGQSFVLLCGCWPGIYEPGKQTPTQPAGPHRTPSVAQKLAKMTMLEKLGLFHFKENISANSLYDHMLDIIKVRKYNQAILTNAFVTELHQLLYLSKSRHDKVPKDRLSRTQFLHVIGYLVANLAVEDVSAKKFGTGLFKLIPKDATAKIWQDGINFVMKVAGKDRLVSSEAPASGGEACVARNGANSLGGMSQD